METRGGIPDGFVAAWLLRCRDEVREVPGEGGWSVRVTERSDTPATELVDLPNRPSDPPPNDGVCPAIGYVRRTSCWSSLPNDAQTPEALEEAVSALLAEGPERLAVNESRRRSRRCRCRHRHS